MRSRFLGILVIWIGLGTIWVLSTHRPFAFQDSSSPGIAQGRELFRIYCASCHGPQGHGDGPVAQSLNPRPADLTRIQQPGSSFPRGQVADMIDGEKTVSAHGNRAMPVWGRIFRGEAGYTQAQEDIHHLVVFLESIQVYRNSND